jgi:hypothetical protein
MRIPNSIRTLLGVSLLCGAGLVAQAQNPVTFTVDMTSQPSAADVYIRGDFNDWGTGNPLTNNGSGIWSTTVNLPGGPGHLYTCKYMYEPGGVWEGGADRQFQLVGGAQTLPLTNKWDDKYQFPSNTLNVTFQVNMSVQVKSGSFTNGTHEVRVSGGYNGWGGGDLLTNNPAVTGDGSNIYSGTFTATTFVIPEVEHQFNRFKFRANGGWEEPLVVSPYYGSNDRGFQTTAPGDKVLPLVFYSDASLCDVLLQDTVVTFVLHLTNGTIATDGHVFDNTVDTVHINGESLLGVWQSWDIFLPQLTNNPPGSDFYANTFLIPAGRPRNQKVKYSIGGPDNEAPQFADHIQWIRSTNSTHTLAAVEFGTNYASARVQPAFGDLKIGPRSGGNVPITWLNCPCVTLQSRTSLSSGSWADLPATDNASSTNMPVSSAAQQYFRLQKRQTP